MKCMKIKRKSKIKLHNSSVFEQKCLAVIATQTEIQFCVFHQTVNSALQHTVNFIKCQNADLVYVQLQQSCHLVIQCLRR